MMNNTTPRWQTWIKAGFRVGVGLGLLAAMIWFNREKFAELRAQPLRWSVLALAAVIALAAILLTFFRWYLLVVAQGLPFRIRDSLRIGFIGFLFSQVIPGAVSGDLVKVWMLAREQERRTVAVATVVLDRIVGLYALALVAGLASLVSWPRLRRVPALRDLVMWVVLVVAIGTAGFAILFAPFLYRGKWLETVTKLRVVGGLFRELLGAITVYQGKWRVILISVLVSVVGHVGFISALYCVAGALEGPMWPARVHFVVAPLGLMINAVPFSPGGLGVGEAAMQLLFSAVGENGGNAFLMMLGFRAIFWVISLIGVGYFLRGASETRRAIAAARTS
jgi:hypothetical protein